MALPRFLGWALEANYPAGANPWNGQPTKIAPVGDIFTPNTAIAAEELNYLFNTVGQPSVLMVTATLNDWGPGATTGAQMAMTGTTALDAVAWDDVARMWMAVGHSNTHMSFSMQDGNDWFSNDTLTSNQYNALASHPASSGILLLTGGANHIVWSTYNGVPTDTGGNLGVTFNGGGVAITHFVSSKILLVSYDSTNHNAAAGASHGTADGTTVDTLTGSLPSTWTTSGNLVCSYFTWAYGPSSDMIVAFGGTTPGTNPSRILHVTWTGSAFAFADLTLPTGIGNASVVGVAYNTSTGLWGAMTYNGTSSTLWLSPDLVAWTASSFPPNQAGGLACIGPYWVTAIPNQFMTVTRWRAYASGDGVNFFGLGSPFATIFAGVPKMSQGPGNVALWTTNGAAVSRRLE